MKETNTEKKLNSFLNRLKPLDRIVIQAHDFPDHDAVSAAYGLSIILQHLGLKTVLVYNGEIDRISLLNMIKWLDIPIKHCSEVNLNPNDKIITVDGCIGEKNVTDMPGDEIAVIDHHCVTTPVGTWYSDIRPSYGATATIIYEYFCLLDIPMPQAVASALLVGLNIDTANLTRGFCSADIKAFLYFNQIAELEQVNKICRNSLIQSELISFEQACAQVTSIGGIATLLLKEGCAKNLLGVLADFLLSVNEYDVVIVAMIQNNGMHISMRSECPKVDAGKVIRQALNQKGMGFGGGHEHMAGGIIPADKTHHFFDLHKAHFSPFIDLIAPLRT